MRKIVLFMALAVCHMGWAETYTLQSSDVVIDASNTITSCSADIKGLHIIIPSSLDGRTVKHIGNSAFLESGVYGVKFPSTLESIGTNAFKPESYSTQYGTKLYRNQPGSLDFSECTSLVSIGNNAFIYNTISSLDLSKCSALVSIGNSAFRDDNNAATIILSELILSGCSSLTTIGENAFDGGKLYTVNMEGCHSITSIGANAFRSSYNYSTIYFPKCDNANNAYKWSDGTNTYKEGATLPSRTLGYTATKIAATFFDITFLVDGEGNLLGETSQSIKDTYNTTSVTATPNDGFIFEGWYESDILYSNKETITIIDVSRDATFTAVFRKCEILFTSGENGSISGELEQRVNTGGDATSVEAIADNDYLFDKWVDENGNLFSTQNPLVLTNVMQDYSLTAMFKYGLVDIVFTSGENGSINGELEQRVNIEGDATSVEAVPDNDYFFYKWVDENGDFFSTQNPLVLTNVSHEYSLKAMFNTGTEGIFTPLKDAYVIKKEGKPERANTNYGSSVALNLYDSKWSARDFNDALIDFGQLSIRLEDISSAILKLSHYSDINNEGSNSFSVYSFSQDWKENEVTWNSHPAIEENASIVEYPATTGKEPIDIDVLSLLKEEGNQTIASFYLKLNSGKRSQSDIVYIASKEHENASLHPRLLIGLKDGVALANISNEKEEKVQFYPNPASNKITIDIANGPKAQITIADLSGSIVLNKTIYQNKASLNIANLNRGVYLLKIKTEDKSYTNKLIVE